MNVKRLFGIILTVLGIAGLIYAAVVFMDTNGSGRQVKSLIVYGLLGAIFFFTGIGLIKNTRDDARPPIQYAFPLNKFINHLTRINSNSNIS